MSFHSRLPALPLVVNDPYFSIWLPGDRPTDAQSIHWSGARKPIKGYIDVDGCRYRFLGKDGVRAAETLEVEVSASATRFSMRAGAVRLEAVFWSPALAADWDALSTPVTFVDFEAWAEDGQAHEVRVSLEVDGRICYDGEMQPELHVDAFVSGGVAYGLMGQKRQRVLSHSGDHVTMDWGYCWMASWQRVTCGPALLRGEWAFTAGERPE
ncbi:MAG: DUF5127 domain-containing protein, partial [Clostridia bacterium]|nr:DUF5127 domain-containing protein [Clostridia bacterium]